MIVLRISMYSLTDFDFNLPAELIAQSPLAERTQSRLLHVQSDRLIDGLFTDVLASVMSGVKEPVEQGMCWSLMILGS